jgi:hypothetical protein
VNGIEKARIILSLIGDQAKVVLSKMPQETSRLLAGVEENTEFDPHDVSMVLAEALEKADYLYQKQAVRERLKKEPQPLSNPSETDMGFSSLSNSNALSFDESAFGATEEETPQEKPKEPTVEIQGHVIHMHGMAKVLQEQKPQIAAFILHHMTESERETIVALLPKEFRESVNAIDIEKVPISAKIMQPMLESLLRQAEIKKDEVVVANKEEKEPTMDASDESLSLEMGSDDDMLSFDSPFGAETESIVMGDEADPSPFASNDTNNEMFETTPSKPSETSSNIFAS